MNNEKEIKIKTKNGKEYIAHTDDGQIYTVYSIDQKQIKSCGYMPNGQVTNIINEVNGSMSIYDVAEYLSTRKF